MKVPGYQLGDKLYENAYSIVYQGTRSADNRSVIIKLSAQDVADTSQVQQFTNSHQIQSQIDHSSVNKSLELVTAGNNLALICEDISGIALKDWQKQCVSQFGFWPVADPALSNHWLNRLIEWSIKFAEGLSCCHQEDVIHNDLSPANLIICEENNHAQIIDFGAAIICRDETDDWELSERLETLTYISPEQTGRLNRKIDYRSDFYAFGATLYQLFANAPPFEAKDLPELIHCHMARNPIPLHERNILIPRALSAIVDKLMSKTPELRYQSGRTLIEDLQGVAKALKTGRLYPLAKLANYDVPEKLFFSNQLFGREKEISQLRRAMNSFSSNKPSLVVIRGEAGSGKSALFQTAIQAPELDDIQVLSGKFEQYQQHPLAAMIHIASHGIENMLTQDQDQWTQWRKQLLEELGSSSKALLDAFPKLDALEIESEAAELPYQEAQVRLRFQIATLFRHLSNYKPVIIFLDDMQWCNLATLEIISTLLHQKNSNLQIIVSYRPEDTPTDHIFLNFFSEVEQLYPHQVINVEGLSEKAISPLLESLFHAGTKNTKPLAKLIFEKTLGIPLFIKEYLRTAYRSKEKALFFNHDTGHWQWEEELLQQIGVSGNVLKLLLETLNQLPEETKGLLPWAAAFGLKFSTLELAHATDSDIEWVHHQLRHAAQKGFIQKDSKDVEHDKIIRKRTLYRFTHDRIQQLSYELASAEKIIEVHWSLANYWLNSFPDLTAQLSAAPHLLIALKDSNLRTKLDQEQTSMIVRVLTNEASRLRHNNEHETRLKYLKLAQELIREKLDRNDNRYAENLPMMAEAEFILGREKTGATLLNEYRELIKDPTKQAASFEEELRLNMKAMNLNAAEASGLEVFSLLGYSLPKFDHDLTQEINQEFDLYQKLNEEQRLVERDFSALVNAERAGIVQSTVYHTVIAARLHGQYQAATLLAYIGINNLMQDGASKHSAALLAGFMLILILKGEFEEAEKIVQLGVSLGRRNPQLLSIGVLYSHLATITGRYFRTPDERYEMLAEGINISRDKGEYYHLLLCKANEIVLSFALGKPLSEIKLIAEDLNELQKSFGHINAAGRLYWRLVLPLCDPSQPNYLERTQFTDEEWASIQNEAELAILAHLKLHQLFWQGDYQGVCDSMPQAESLAQHILTFTPIDDHHFLKIIAKLKLISTDDQAALDIALGELESSVSHLKLMYETNPSCFHHRWLIIEGEKARIKGNDQASQLFYQAAEDAKDNGHIHMYAFAQECHAHYWQEHKRKDYARLHLTLAIQGYTRWGCQTKLNQLDKEWDIKGELSLQLSPWNLSLTDSPRVSPVGQTKILNQLSLLKVAQAIAEEIDLEQLLAAIVELTVENTGAEKGFLLLSDGGIFRPFASAYTTAGGIQHEVYREKQDPIANTIINYCSQSKQPVMLEDAASALRFKSDPFIQDNQVRSLFCFPILHKRELVGHLLFYNSQSNSVFTQNHLQYFQTLAPQIAISMENAQLYQELKELNVDLEGKIDLRTREIAAANEELRSFSFSVSHDLKAPLRAIEGFSEALSEDCTDLLDDDGKLYLRHIIEGTGRMKEIIDGLLMLAQSTQTTLSWEEVDLSLLVEEKIRWLFTMEPGRQFQYEVQPKLKIRGDLRLLRQMVDNLVGNAWKYSQKNPNAHMSFKVSRQDNTNVYSIADNGMGFDAAHAEGLFKPFQRFHSDAEVEGTGIGLATVYRIINRHGGKIWAESKKNEGATFYFTLPDHG